ncbi:HNH endonuclease [Deinococcus yunweiensis]|uniref:HNH endonuclease n=1 Tax=Deinococcus yunweiensis TaxID=367282 RepID=UPI00398F838F
MHCLVLTTRPEDNRYGDTPQAYVFPERYRALFEPLTRGEELTAVLYEPRRGQGRQAYVGWTTITAPPVQLEGGLWSVDYAQEVRPFPRVVPKAVDGRDFEALLRATPLVKHGPTLQGRSVRTLLPGDLLAILAAADVLSEPVKASLSSADQPSERERIERVVRILARDGSFRAEVIRSYGFRCAVSRIGYHDAARFGGGQLVDGAHLRPVAAQGSDDPSNGLALTPSLHQLFDAGLFTLGYDGDHLRVRVSSDLRHLDLAPNGGAFSLNLNDGQVVHLPENVVSRPDPASLAYHQTMVFRR